MPRFTPSGLSFDVAIVLAVWPDGGRVSDVARVLGAPNTSVTTVLRQCAEEGLAERVDQRFRLRSKHPAATDLVALGLRLRTPPDAISLVLRACPAVQFASVDAGGFVVAEDRGASDALASLDSALAVIARGRDDVPRVLRFQSAEFVRILRSDVGLRRRVRTAVVLKSLGTLPD